MAKVTKSQQIVMLDFFEAYPALITGKFEGPEAKLFAATKWRELADLLNTGGEGPSKTPDKWQKTWQDWRCLVKKNAAKRRAGEPNMRPPSDLELRAEALIRSTTNPAAEVREAGMDDETESDDCVSAMARRFFESKTHPRNSLNSTLQAATLKKNTSQASLTKKRRLSSLEVPADHLEEQSVENPLLSQMVESNCRLERIVSRLVDANEQPREDPLLSQLAESNSRLERIESIVSRLLDANEQRRENPLPTQMTESNSRLERIEGILSKMADANERMAAAQEAVVAYLNRDGNT